MKDEILFSCGKGEEILKERQRVMDYAGGVLDEREWILLVEAYERSKQYKRAMLVCQEALQKYPDNWELHCCAGSLSEHMGKYEDAIEYFERAGKIGTYFCDEKYLLASCYQKLGRFSEAYQIYLEIEAIHRKNGYDVEADQALRYAKQIESKI